MAINFVIFTSCIIKGNEIFFSATVNLSNLVDRYQYWGFKSSCMWCSLPVFLHMKGTVLHPRRPESSTTSLWKPHILHDTCACVYKECKPYTMENLSTYSLLGCDTVTFVRYEPVFQGNTVTFVRYIPVFQGNTGIYLTNITVSQPRREYIDRFSIV
jgi:hypothetical protein